MANNDIDFAALPDAEAARLMAEKDGWRVEMQGEYWSGVIYRATNTNTGEQYTSQTRDFAWRQALKNTNYPHCLNAAVGWLARMGLRWEKRIRNFDNVEFVLVYMEVEMPEFAKQRGLQWRGIECVITDTCPTARALCNAGWQAVKAREARDAANGA